MNILMIGNGFDLAHGLPTRYPDFLEFVEAFVSIRGNHEAMKWGGLQNTAKPIYECLDRFIFERRPGCDEFYEHVINNIWIEYFKQNEVYQKENWIDFESEISNVIKSVEKNMQGNIDSPITQLDNEFLAKIYVDTRTDSRKWERKFSDLHDILLTDLNRLIRAFEIYLCEYIDNYKIVVKVPDIKGLQIHRVISFNYTNTYSKLYNLCKDTKNAPTDESALFDFIHGKANINNSIETNNMVLGIDEYLPADRKDVDTEFIAFKKYYQRIYKGTGCRYKEWLDAIRDSRNKAAEALRRDYPTQIPFIKFPRDSRHKLYIFGHSLDVTDKDILRDLILNDNVYTTIFYPNKKELGKKIANLVKVIGQDELIRRTGGSTKTIEFRKQQGVVGI